MIKNVDLASPAKALVALGFSGFEAEVYVRLLAEPDPVTGYRIAKALGKPVANTYKAIESLSNKGAVIVDDGNNRLCRAVGPEELLSKIERRFQTNQRQAAQKLARIKQSRADDRVYHLRSTEQVFERCRTMLRGAKQVALVDIFPVPMTTLRGDLESTARRGVEVLAKTYSPARVKGAQVFQDPESEAVLRQWPGEWLNLVVDGRETLLAFLGPECAKVNQAIWSGSAYLSCVFHSALLSEILVAGLQERSVEATSTSLLKFVRKYSSVNSIRGMGSRELLKAFQAEE